MQKIIFLGSLLALVFSVGVGTTLAAPVEKTDGFVCPVLNSNVGEHNPNTIVIAGGDYSLIPSGSPHTISIPTHATNADGAGSPAGSHSSPTDTDYTAIWSQ